MQTIVDGLRHHRKRLRASLTIAAREGYLRGHLRGPNLAGFRTSRAPRALADIRVAAIADALAKLARAELQNLVVAASALPAEASDSLSWITHLADWELNRRAGLRVRAQPPDAAIPSERRVTSVVVVTMLRDGYAESGGTGSAWVVALLDAIVRALNTCGGQQHGGPRPQDGMTSCRFAKPRI